MANYKGHIAGATACCAVYVTGLYLMPGEILNDTEGILGDWQFVAGLFVIAILFGLWPDIDTNSKGQDIFYAIAFILNILLIASGNIEASAYFGLIAMTPVISKHRGWTHSKLAMVLVPLPIFLAMYFYRESLFLTGLLVYGSAVVGYFSHLLLDGRVTKLVRFKG